MVSEIFNKEDSVKIKTYLEINDLIQDYTGELNRFENQNVADVKVYELLGDYRGMALIEREKSSLIIGDSKKISKLEKVSNVRQFPLEICEGDPRLYREKTREHYE